ncbi:DNA polymerase III subunit alpha [Planotetraspora kaengkrachanensis]|uniref:DNA-directed DNA polymerase n=1 Tax=Planotetraspora kaengkrachanensis TaxID=575193 RepID=A0A8J3PNW7_9ACTN|nr:DNA polymerase III subunit alpha [Planotetraspora kaengkrachanensis]GIG77011.1 DNA polymerase III subunit alpha [Planotetraspora kaengkrachanensis]
MGDPFVHLHVHTEYSMLDGAARLNQMFELVGELGMPAIAITDHGNMHGAYDFYKQAIAAGVKPVLGIEAYVAPGSRLQKAPVMWGEPHQKSDDVSAGGYYTHMTIWARNRVGLGNLMRLSSRAYTEGYVGKWPRMDAAILAEHSEGLMAATGCPSGEVQTRLRLGQYDEALRAAAKYQEIFGKENYFLEVMDHGLDIERRVRDGLTRIGRELDIPPVVTNDSHYTYESDAAGHDALLCVQTGGQLSDPDRFRFDGSGYHVRSADEMRALDSSDLWREGCRNTLLVAERVEPGGMFGFRNLMPAYPVPGGTTEEEYFRQQVWEGMRRRFPGGVDEEHRARVENELGVIVQMGFPSYFLVVSDFVMWAKDNGIRVGPGRGSAAGSLVGYSLGITDLDPIPYGLVFERFLNPERVSMPDIDIDFDERRRADVIRHVTEKWGADKVALIATFGTIKAKAAVKDAARVLGHPYALGDRISKAFPPAVMGRDIPLSGIFDKDHPRYDEAGELRELYDEDAGVKAAIDLGRGLEGLVRQTGVHAAGVIMSAEPLTDHIPIMRRESDGAIITQFDYPACEKLGLLKMDFLGLRNLTIIDDCLKMIEADSGAEIELLEVPLDDPRTYELLARGDTLGVFQLDGGGMRSLLRLMRPDGFEDISAALALYRPGPMGAGSHTNYALRKNAQQEITPIHIELEEPLRDILGTTYGLIVYQEQVMAIAQKVAGYSPGGADLLRRAMSKKKKSELDEQFESFEKGMRDNGFSAAAVKALWDILLPFSDYAFNKSHTAGYGLVSYWTAYLKANFPAEYMAALLTSVKDDKDKSALYLNECRRMGIRVLPPDVNDSDSDFTPRGGDVRFGLSAVRNVGGNVVAGIIAAREEKDRFTDFRDFLRKVPAVVCNRRVIESLIKAGAFDSLEHVRKGLLMVHEQAVDAITDIKKNEAIGQDSLFGAAGGAEDQIFDVRIPPGEWDKTTLLRFEREMLGLYVSDHPLLGVEHVLASGADCSVAALQSEDRPDGQIVTVGGLLTGLQRKVTKKGDTWVLAMLEDLEGAIEVMIFPSAYQLSATILVEDAIVFVKGRIDKREDVAKIIAMEVTAPDLTAETGGPLVVSLPLARCTPSVVGRLKEVLTTHPGATEVHLQVHNGPRTTVVRLDDRLRVTPSPALMGDLKQLLGPACLGS